MLGFDTQQEKSLERLGKLRDYFAEYQALPSYRYMQDLLGIKSKETIGKFIAKLKEENFLDEAPDKKLIPGERFFERPLSNNSVQAGGFTQIYSEGGEYISIDRVLVKKPSLTEIVPVKGNSMKDKGLLDGDSAVVEKRSYALPGDIVVALINDEQTIKTLEKENGQFVLVPANKNFEIIRPKQPFAIYGVVISSYRTYYY